MHGTTVKKKEKSFTKYVNFSVQRLWQCVMF